MAPDISRATPSPSGPSPLQRERFSWPQDLNTIGLTQQDVTIIETAIKNLRESNQAFPTKGREIFFALKRDITRVYLQTAQGEVISPLPRTLVVYRTKSFVLLRGAQTLSGLPKKPPLCRLSYNPENGAFYWKRDALSCAEQTLIASLLPYPSQKSPDGFPEIHHADFIGRKRRYYEKKYELSGEDLPKIAPNPHAELTALFHLQLALHLTHSISYHPPALFQLTGPKVIFENITHYFHGNICPQNIGLEPSRESIAEGVPIIEKMRLINWEGVLLPECIQNHPGWTPPEGVRFAKKVHDPLKTDRFYANYGKKRDAWAFGLFAGLVLKRNLPSNPTPSPSLPPFSFILNKIQVREDKLDDSQIAELEQREVDSEITEIIKGIDKSTPIGETLYHWWLTIARWLQVDPDKRPDLAALYFPSQ